LYCSRLSTRLAGYDGVTYPHVLQAIMVQVSGTLETCEHTLETCEPNCIGRHAMPFFIYEACDLLGTVRHVVAPKPSLTWRQGPEL
jgi:hypothetical protein